MIACPGTACPRYIGQGCACPTWTEPDPYAHGEPIDMRSRERRIREALGLEIDEGHP